MTDHKASAEHTLSFLSDELKALEDGGTLDVFDKAAKVATVEALLALTDEVNALRNGKVERGIRAQVREKYEKELREGIAARLGGPAGDA